MARRRTDRIYGTSAHPMIESLPLLLAFLAGTIGGILLKLSGAHALISAGYAALVLVAYAATAYALTPLRIDSETIGDNSYYLGFLFTLTSLAVTLYFVVEAGPNQADLIPEIISGFGVALSSTIVGVFLRVLMLQLKVDLDARERRARIELDEAARRFRTELGISLDKVKGFSTESLQQVREREERMRKACDELMANMQAELLKSAAEFGPALRESVKAQTEAAFGEIAKAVTEASGQASYEIRLALSMMAKVSQDTAERNREGAAQIEAAFQRMQAAADRLADGAVFTVSKLASAQERSVELAEVVSRRLEGESAVFAGALSEARHRLDGGSGAFTAATERASAALDDAARRFEEALRSSMLVLEGASERTGRNAEGQLDGWNAPSARQPTT